MAVASVFVVGNITQVVDSIGGATLRVTYGGHFTAVLSVQ